MSAEEIGVADSDFITLLGSIVELCVVAANQPRTSPAPEVIQQRISKLSELTDTLKARAPSFLEPEMVSTLEMLMKLIKFYVYEPTFDEVEAQSYEETNITPNLPAFESFLDMVFLEERPDLFLYNPIAPEIRDRIRSRIFITLDDLDDIIHVLTSLKGSVINFRKNENLLAAKVSQFLQTDLLSLPKSTIKYLKARWGQRHNEKGDQDPSECRLPQTLNKKHVYFFVHDWLSITDNGFTIKDIGFIREIQKPYYDYHSLVTLPDIEWLK